MTVDVVRFPKGLSDAVRSEIKQYLACEKSIQMLNKQLTQVNHINHARDLQARRKRAEEFMKQFEEKYNGFSKQSSKALPN